MRSEKTVTRWQQGEVLAYGTWVMLGKPRRISHLFSGTFLDPRASVRRQYAIHKTFVVDANKLVTPHDSNQYRNVEKFDALPIVRHVKRAIGQRLYIGGEVVCAQSRATD